MSAPRCKKFNQNGIMLSNGRLEISLTQIKNIGAKDLANEGTKCQSGKSPHYETGEAIK